MRVLLSEADIRLDGQGRRVVLYLWVVSDSVGNILEGRKRGRAESRSLKAYIPEVSTLR